MYIVRCCVISNSIFQWQLNGIDLLRMFSFVDFDVNGRKRPEFDATRQTSFHITYFDDLLGKLSSPAEFISNTLHTSLQLIYVHGKVMVSSFISNFYVTFYAFLNKLKFLLPALILSRIGIVSISCNWIISI